MTGYTYPGKKPGRPTHPELVAHERGVVDHADYFVATIFRGRGKFDRRECATLELARAAAFELIGAERRPASIYAVRGNREVFAELVQPHREGKPNGPMGNRTDIR